MSDYTTSQLAISAAFVGFAGKLIGDFQNLEAQQDAINVARAAKNDATDSMEVNKKIKLLAQAAKQSRDNQWSNADIKEALKHAKEQKFPGVEKKPTSLATFWSNVALAVHPTVRQNFPNIVKACQEAWAEENKLSEDAEHPVQSFGAKRLGALVISVATSMRKDPQKVVITKRADIVEWVKARNPKTDADQVAKRCKAMAKAVEAMMAEFHYQPFQTVVNYFKQENLSTELVNARDAAKREAKAKQPITLVKPEANAPAGNDKLAAAKAAAKQQAITAATITAEMEDDDDSADIDIDGLMSDTGDDD